MTPLLLRSALTAIAQTPSPYMSLHPRTEPLAPGGFVRTTVHLPRVMHLAIALVAALWIPASAQTTPSSYFTVTKVPQIARQAITADFNGDGRLDIIANATVEGVTPLLVLTLGRSDGTFPAPQALGVAGEPLGVADVNGDRRVDVLVRIGANYSVLPGNGNGTFGSPRLVHTAAAGGFSIAVVGSFTAGDAIPDVVVTGADAAGNSVLLLYPGNGNFTFGVPYPQPMDEGGIVQLRAVHLDNDGLSDLVGTNICCSVLMLRNTGSNAFESRTLAIASDIGEVHAADLNGDGVVDVIASQTLPEFYPFDPRPGIAVLWGGFSATTYETYDAGVRGEYALAFADFTGDGQMDIASGNWSQYRDDDVGPQLWSSVSVLKGRVTNAATHSVTFAAPVTFALGSVNGEGYTSSYSLSAGDFNGDGRIDLAHAPGAILLNRPPVPNRRPTVFIGADRTINQDSAQGFYVFGEASDPDGHWLTYSWNASQKPSPVIQAYLGYDPGPVTLTLTVDDGHGGVASDSVTFTVADSYIQVVSLASPTVVQVGQPYTVRWSATDLEGPLHDFSLSGLDQRRPHIHVDTGLRQPAWHGNVVHLAESRTGQHARAAAHRSVVWRRETLGRVVAGVPPDCGGAAAAGRLAEPRYRRSGRPGFGGRNLWGRQRVRLRCGHLGQRGRTALRLDGADRRLHHRSACAVGGIGERVDEGRPDDSQRRRRRRRARLDLCHALRREGPVAAVARAGRRREQRTDAGDGRDGSDLAAPAA